MWARGSRKFARASQSQHASRGVLGPEDDLAKETFCKPRQRIPSLRATENCTSRSSGVVRNGLAAACAVVHVLLLVRGSVCVCVSSVI